MKKTYIIAEAGVNHNGDIETAMELVEKAVEAGANAIKFQTFKATSLVTNTAKQTNYQQKNIGKITSQLEMLQQLELTREQFADLKFYCEKLNIDFMSTPFDEESLHFLINELKMNTIKISSGDLNNYPYLYEIAKKDKRIIISTGMSSLEEIHKALAFMAYGLCQKTISYKEDVINFYQSSEAKELLNRYVTILQCTTAYPTPLEEVNLQAIPFLHKELKLPVGFSDHTTSTLIPAVAVSMGACVIEKHFTLDKNMQGPDHKASLEPKQLKEMVDAIRQVEQAQGIYGKVLTQTEKENINFVRKSLVAKVAIKTGDIFTAENIIVKRPGEGISPENYWDLLGQKAEKDYQKDELI